MEAVETRVAVIAIIVREGTQVAALNDLQAWCRRSETLSEDVPTITYPYGPVKTKPRLGMIRDGA